jgi:UDP-4-amino-4-deoxy-L-arabinose formyltransferase/UDP-glucuronic acid dehydrogenase (UDP-4-keto-hexauronic acid decarboxylating)
MSVVVLAYHEMGCLGLRVLLERGVDVSAVFTYEDDPAENIWFGSVAELARGSGIPTFTTEDVNAPEWVARIRALEPDVLFSFYYRHMIQRPIREIPRYGCVNLHGSLLPKYRGRSPVNWQLVHGETESGVTLHCIIGRADAGDIIGRERVAVGPDDTAIDLYRKLLPAAEKLIHRELAGILVGTAPRIPQDDSQATVFGGRRPEDGRIDWRRPAQEIHNLVRAVASPWPGAFSDGPGGRLMVWRTKLCPTPAGVAPLAPGQMARDHDRVLVGTGDGLIELVDFTAPGNTG